MILASCPHYEKQRCTPLAERGANGLQNRVKRANAGSNGSVAEWFKALVLKTSVRGTVPWVRIPPLPPSFFEIIDLFSINLDLPANLPTKGKTLWIRGVRAVGSCKDPPRWHFNLWRHRAGNRHPRLMRASSIQKKRMVSAPALPIEGSSALARAYLSANSRQTKDKANPYPTPAQALRENEYQSQLV